MVQVLYRLELPMGIQAVPSAAVCVISLCLCCCSCRVSVQLSADPKMDIPAAIIKFVLTVLSPVVYRLAKHVIHAYVRKPGSALHSRMQERGHFYKDVEAKVQQCLSSQAQPSEAGCGGWLASA